MRQDGFKFCDEGEWTREENEALSISQKIAGDQRAIVELEATECSSQDNEQQVQNILNSVLEPESQSDGDWLHKV